MKPKIYFAGKIGKDDWRHRIVPGLREAVWDDATLFNQSLVIDCGDWDYGGPFFVSCDHGCAHGTNSHGARTDSCYSHDSGLEERHADIFAINRYRLLRCNYVFAHIETPDCYGTLIELGMAHTEAIPIILTFARSITSAQRADMWMVEQLASGRVIAGTAKHCWDTILNRAVNP